MSDETCRICEGTRSIKVLNLWRVQREFRNNGGDLNAALNGTPDNLPFITLENACQLCCGEDAHNEAMRELTARMGGDPYAAATFEGTGTA